MRAITASGFVNILRLSPRLSAHFFCHPYPDFSFANQSSISMSVFFYEGSLSLLRFCLSRLVFLFFLCKFFLVIFFCKEYEQQQDDLNPGLFQKPQSMKQCHFRFLRRYSPSPIFLSIRYHHKETPPVRFSPTIRVNFN